MTSKEDFCPPTEVKARVVALETALSAFKELMNERDRRYSHEGQSQDKNVTLALSQAEKATLKAENATERRLEGLNELRDMAADQAKTFARAEEVKLTNNAFDKRLDVLTDLVNQKIAHSGGIKDMWGYLVGAAGVAIGLSMILGKFLR